MKVKVASTAGFCMGVRRAVNIALDSTRERPAPVATLGSLIHNPQVVELLQSRGIATAAAAPDRGTVIIRSHGVPPATRAELKAKGLTVVDATCPRVTRVHSIVRAQKKRGALIVVLGDAGHAEVLGIAGEANGAAVLVAGPDDVADLPAAQRVCLVAQTTQDRERFLATAEALRRRYAGLAPEDLVIADTICDSTRSRQEEVKRLAREVEAVVVVGGRDSANTRRLAELARAEGLPAFLVETEADLDPAALAAFKVVGLTAGASTPNWMIRRVYYALRRIGPPVSGYSWLRDAVRWLVLSNLYVAIGAGAMTYAASRLQGFAPLWREMLVALLYAFAVHTVTALADRAALELSEPARAKAFGRHRRAWYLASLGAAALAAGLSFSLGLADGAAFVLLAAASLLYPVHLLRGRAGMPAFWSLAEVPGGKDFFMALGWAAVIVVLPLIGRPEPAALAAFALVFGLVFCRALLRDFRDLQADRMVGHETLPIVFGARSSRRLLYGSLAVTAGLVVAATAGGLAAAPAGYLLAIPFVYAAFCVPLFTRQTVLQGFRAEMIADFVFVLAGLVAMV